jgi:hypothetical protein
VRAFERESPWPDLTGGLIFDMFERFAQKRRQTQSNASEGKRNKFEDKLAARLALDPKRRRSGGVPQGSLTIRLNMPVMRKDQVWLDHSH